MELLTTMKKHSVPGEVDVSILTYLRVFWTLFIYNVNLDSIGNIEEREGDLYVSRTQTCFWHIYNEMN